MKLEIEAEVWRRDLHQRPNRRTIVRPDLMLVPERKTRLVRLDPASGALLWSARVKDTWGWLACNADSVFYLNRHNLLQCHALDSGAERWTAELTGINGWLVPAGRNLLVGGWRGYTPLIAIDVETGALRWKDRHVGSRLAEPVDGPWGIALASLDEPVVRFLEPETGTTNAELPLPEHGREPDATPLLRRHGDSLLIAGQQGRYYQLSSARGPWTVLFEHPEAIHTNAPPIVGDGVFFTDTAGHLNVYDLGSGQRRWSLPWQRGRTDLLPATASPRGMVAMASASGHISIVDPTGALVWKRHVAKQVETNLTWISDDTLVAGTPSSVVAIRTGRPGE